MIPFGAAPLAVLPLRIVPLGIVPPSVVLETLEGPIIIFRVESDGSRRWMKAAANFEDAKALVKVLAASSPGEYVITNLTGDKTSIKFSPKRIMVQIGEVESRRAPRTEIRKRQEFSSQTNEEDLVIVSEIP